MCRVCFGQVVLRLPLHPARNGAERSGKRDKSWENTPHLWVRRRQKCDGNLHGHQAHGRGSKRTGNGAGRSGEKRLELGEHSHLWVRRRQKCDGNLHGHQAHGRGSKRMGTGAWFHHMLTGCETSV